MKSDITRSTFDKSKRYSSVQVQQGRITLDADWNEHEDIRKYFERTAIQDIVGLAGTPITPALPNGGFVVTVSGKKISIGPGHYYVDGILCENDAQVQFANQPFLPLPGDPTTGKALVYLDVYEQFISFWDDANLSDAALGGRETAGRQRIVWRARTLAVSDPNITCADAFKQVADPSTGKLAAIAKATTNTAVCVPKADAQYRRPENQLYRVEVHVSGTATTATFKWSRENGSVVSKASVTAARTVTVVQVGRDQRLSFAAGDWIELIDLPRETRGEAGDLFKINQISGNDLQLDPAGSAITATYDAATLKARRWESAGAQTIAQWKGANTDQPVPSGSPGFGTYVQLEDGVWIRIAAGQYAVGDYWLIPARSILGDVLWPLNGVNDPTLLPKFGTTHHYAPLAIVDIDANAVLRDCRNPYAPLNADIQLFYGGGDGQEAPPIKGNATALTLPEPLTSGVSRGKIPIAGAMVKYSVVQGSGTLTGTNPAPTNSNGLASIQWTLDPTTYFQKVRAVLLDADGNETHLPIEFTATLRTADEVAYNPPDQCSILSGVTTVKDALDRMCDIHNDTSCCVSIGKRGEFATMEEAIKALQGKVKTICFCLDGETYKLGKEVYDMMVGKAGFVAVEISGIRGLTTLVAEKVLGIQKLKWLKVSDLRFQMLDLPMGMAIGSVNRCEFLWVDFDYSPDKITADSMAVVVQSAGRLQFSDCLFYGASSLGTNLGGLFTKDVRTALAAGDAPALQKALKASLTNNPNPGILQTDAGSALQNLSLEDDNLSKALTLATTPNPTAAQLTDLSNSLIALSKSGSQFISSAISQGTALDTIAALPVTPPATTTTAPPSTTIPPVTNIDLSRLTTAANLGAAAAAAGTNLTIAPVFDANAEAAASKAAAVVPEPASLVLLNNIIEAHIDNCQFFHPVILYGSNPAGFPTFDLADKARDIQWQNAGRLWCRNNIFAKMSVSATPGNAKTLVDWISKAPQVYSEIKMTDNTFSEPASFVVAQRVTLTGNSFVFGRVNLPSMWVWGATASIYGCHAEIVSAIRVAAGVRAGTTNDNPNVNIL
ncbi:MAG: hypothetical protein GC165_06870 [Armatimonadetes bacterium]|nr:hypothetical protein [Armatimonadota bacterium]